MRYFCCGSLLFVFDVGFRYVSPYVCTDCFSSVEVAEWPSFRKELPARFTICSIDIMSICNFS